MKNSNVLLDRALKSRNNTANGLASRFLAAQPAPAPAPAPKKALDLEAAAAWLIRKQKDKTDAITVVP